MKRLAIVFLLAASLSGSAVAATDGVGLADKPVLEQLRQSFPSARERFVNCPGKSRAGFLIICEVRLAIHDRVRKGHAVVEPIGEDGHPRWLLESVHLAPSLPQKWRRCHTERSVYLRGQSAASLKVYAVSCFDAREIKSEIGDLAVRSSGRRLPRHFVEGVYERNMFGFVVGFFRCRGQVGIRKGDPNPRARETAVCRNRFGDALVYSFEQGFGRRYR